MVKDDIIFKYRDEEAGGTGGTLLGKLAEKISQKDLAQKDVEAIARCVPALILTVEFLPLETTLLRLKVLYTRDRWYILDSPPLKVLYSRPVVYP